MRESINNFLGLFPQREFHLIPLLTRTIHERPVLCVVKCWEEVSGHCCPVYSLEWQTNYSWKIWIIQSLESTVIPAMVQRLRFSINVQHLSHKFGFPTLQRWQRLKHRWQRLPKTHKIGFQCNTVAYLWSRCLIMSKKRRCTISGITVIFLRSGFPWMRPLGKGRREFPRQWCQNHTRQRS